MSTRETQKATRPPTHAATTHLRPAVREANALDVDVRPQEEQHAAGVGSAFKFGHVRADQVPPPLSVFPLENAQENVPERGASQLVS